MLLNVNSQQMCPTTCSRVDLAFVSSVLQEEFNGHEGSVLCLVWIEEYEAVMSCGDDATIRIW